MTDRGSRSGGRKHPPRDGKTGWKESLARVPRAVWVAGALSLVLCPVGFLAGRSLGRLPGSVPYREIIDRWCAPRRYNVNPDLAAAILETESSGRARAVSSAGALGLMQLMPPTAAAMAKELGLAEPSREDLFDEDLNIRLGVYYLSKLRKRFGEEREFVIAAYHAGPTRVDGWRRRRADLSAADVIDELASPATRLYVDRVLRRWKALSGSRRRGGG